MASHQNPIDQFIRDALGQGKSEAEIKQALTDAGWPADQIEAGFQGWAGSKWGLPVPKPKTQVSARDAFLYLTLFFALALSVWATSFIWFALIELWVSDPLNTITRYAGRDAFRPWVSILLVSFPAYFLLARLIARQIRQDPERRHSPVRRWITYAILFCTAVTMLIDLIVVTEGFLGGDLTREFVAKCAVVALVHGVVFIGYFSLQGRDDQAGAVGGTSSLPRTLLWMGVGVALVTIGLALFYGKAPSLARAERLDQMHVNNLNGIEAAVNCHFAAQGRLPANLDAVESRCSGVVETRAGYRYRPLTGNQFELCATFERENRLNRPVAGGDPSFADHPAGEHCFVRTLYADPPAQGAGEPSPPPLAPSAPSPKNN